MTEEAMMEGHYKEVCGMRVLMLLRIHPYPPPRDAVNIP